MIYGKKYLFGIFLPNPTHIFIRQYYFSIYEGPFPLRRELLFKQLILTEMKTHKSLGIGIREYVYFRKLLKKSLACCLVYEVLPIANFRDLFFFRILKIDNEIIIRIPIVKTISKYGMLRCITT